jgi:hypothetical protein
VCHQQRSIGGDRLVRTFAVHPKARVEVHRRAPDDVVGGGVRGKQKLRIDGLFTYVRHGHLQRDRPRLSRLELHRHRCDGGRLVPSSGAPRLDIEVARHAVVECHAHGDADLPTPIVSLGDVLASVCRDDERGGAASGRRGRPYLRRYVVRGRRGRLTAEREPQGEDGQRTSLQRVDQPTLLRRRSLHRVGPPSLPTPHPRSRLR